MEKISGSFEEMNPESFNEGYIFRLCAEIYPDDHSDAPAHLRRIFSLMRGTGATVVSRSSCKWEGKATCTVSKSCSGFQGCLDYTLQLVDDCSEDYGNFIEKRCYRFTFFSGDINCGDIDSPEKVAALAKENPMGAVVGYCVLHLDVFDPDPEADILEVLSYVPYAIISPLSLGGDSTRIYTIPHKQHIIDFGGAEFVCTGFFSSGGNNRTNACGHASIKMALRPYTEDNVTAKCISLIVSDFRAKNRSGKSCNDIALAPCEIVEVIKKVEGGRFDAELLHMGAVVEDRVSQFIRTIYTAIESRWPVIITYSENSDDEGGGQGDHVIFLAGHRLEANDWWCNGLVDYWASGRNNPPRYTPSYLWTDSLLVMDDSQGPLFFMPANFIAAACHRYLRKDVLSDEHDTAAARTGFAHLEEALHLSARPRWLPDSVYAIFVKPNDVPASVKDSRLVEQVAWVMVQEIAEESNKREDWASWGGVFHSFFFQGWKQNRLILRPVLATSDEYVASIQTETNQEAFAGTMQRSLPKWVWIVEISVPELYGSGPSKIGEIVLDPYVLTQALTENKPWEDELFKCLRAARIASMFAIYYENGYVDRVRLTGDPNSPGWGKAYRCLEVDGCNALTESSISPD